MHEVRRVVATLREIFMNKSSSVKLTSLSESIIARALNRMPRISCECQTFLNKKLLSKSVLFTFFETLVETF